MSNSDVIACDSKYVQRNMFNIDRKQSRSSPHPDDLIAMFLHALELLGILRHPYFNTETTPLVKRCQEIDSLPSLYKHCQYQSFCFWHVDPAAHVFGPFQLMPPHCPHLAAVAVAVPVAAGADVAVLDFVFGRHTFVLDLLVVVAVAVAVVEGLVVVVDAAVVVDDGLAVVVVAALDELWLGAGLVPPELKTAGPGIL